jgi:hypothetical protein
MPRKVEDGGKVAPVFFSSRDFSIAERLLNRVATQLHRAVWDFGRP